MISTVRVTLAGLAVAVLGACSAIPQVPEPVVTDVVPSPTPSALPSELVDSPYGFSVPEQAAYRIRNYGCAVVVTGSGFAIDSHTIITNAHVVSYTHEIEVTGHDGRDFTVASSRVSTIGDIGIITIEEPLDVWVELADEDPGRRDPVLVAGYPDGEELEVATGRIENADFDTLDNAEFVFATNVQVEPGSSGSAAYDEEGRVIGIVYAADFPSVFSSLEDSYIVPVSILSRTLEDGETLEVNDPECTF